MQKQSVYHFPDGEPTDPRAKAAWFEKMTQLYENIKEGPAGDVMGVGVGAITGFLSGLSPKFLNIWENLTKRPDYQQWYKNRSSGSFASTSQTNWLKRICDE